MNESLIRVVVVEDSLVQRAHLVAVLEADGDIGVVGQATTALEALDLIDTTRPDVVTLDLQLPDRPGAQVIEAVMSRMPTPILVLSSTVDGPHSTPAIEALIGGALEALPKPLKWTASSEAELRRTVRMLSKVTVIRHRVRASPDRITPRPRATCAPVVGLAASTGGPAALATLLGGMGDVRAPVLVVQHLHADFVAGLVEWMARVSALPVELAQAGQVLRPGHVYIGPGGTHLRIDSDSHVDLSRSPESLHCPSADELFLSMAENAGAAAVGVVLTGMGSDGTRGLLALRRSGGRTFSQDEASCAVYGMPHAAVDAGAVCEVFSLDAIAGAVTKAVDELWS